MKPVADILYKYLENAIYNPSNAVLDVEKLPEDFQDAASGLQYFVECALEADALAKALERGNLGAKVPDSGNEMASSIKSLYASLKHLTWQTKQIAKGDYSQNVTFMGEFSDSFNMMVEQLAERQKKLEDEVALTQKKSASLEQGVTLLTALIQYVPQQIFVVEENTLNILIMNDAAKNEMDNDPDYLTNLMRYKPCDADPKKGQEIEVTITHGKNVRYFIVKFYSMEWFGSNAEIIVANDVSATRIMMQDLEAQAYRDVMTGLFNRTYGIFVLNRWLAERKRFALIFADLDKLKYVNDEFGHSEGDKYIINAGNTLKTISVDCVACRLGGDEFMMLVPNMVYDEAHSAMMGISEKFANHPYLEDKTFSYNMSFGIVAVDADNELPSSAILEMADERMYENKRAKKRGLTGR